MKTDFDPAPISAFPGRAAIAGNRNIFNTWFNWIFNKGERQYGAAGSNGQGLYEIDFTPNSFWNGIGSEEAPPDDTESARTPESCEGMDSRPGAETGDATEACDGQDSVAGTGSGDTPETCDGKDAKPENRDGHAMETQQGSASFPRQAGVIAAAFSPWDASAWVLNFYLNRSDGAIQGGELVWQSADGNLPFNVNQFLTAAGKQDAGDTLNVRSEDRAWR